MSAYYHDSQVTASYPRSDLLLRAVLWIKPQVSPVHRLPYHIENKMENFIPMPLSGVEKRPLLRNIVVNMQVESERV